MRSTKSQGEKSQGEAGGGFASLVIFPCGPSALNLDSFFLRSRFFIGNDLSVRGGSGKLGDITHLVSTFNALPQLQGLAMTGLASVRWNCLDGVAVLELTFSEGGLHA